jgi:hypothetical protein
VTAILRTLALAMTVLAAMPVVAQTQSIQSGQAASMNQQAERAKERCLMNRGVDCDTAEGLKEWQLLERSRGEAIQEGSRHLLPARPRPAPTRSLPAAR